MKIRMLMASMALFTLCGVAVAGEYCVTANRRINLRDAASLQGAVLETVAPGTTLAVNGEYDRWLRINRNGSEAWMANWVDYSRLENCGGTGSQQGTSAGTASDIDNCCFVDRQCHTDQDWTDGYHAFQNNQCPRPPGSGAPTSSQPTSGGPAQIDNCCFVDRQCHTDQDWTDGYHAFQNNQCPAPGQTGASGSSQSASGVLLRSASGIVIGYPSGLSILPSTVYTLDEVSYSYSNCCEANWQCNSDQDWAAGFNAFQNDQCKLPGRVLSIVGEPDFVQFFVQRLDELKNKLPQRYDYVLSGLDKIQQMTWQPCGGGFVQSNLGMYFICWDPPYINGWDTHESAVLVHEACHVHRYLAGLYHLKWHGLSRECHPEIWLEGEEICREMELQVLIELEAQAHVIEWARSMVAGTYARDPDYTPATSQICSMN